MYEPLLSRVLGQLADTGMAERAGDIPAFREKADFGDMDVLVAWSPALVTRGARTEAVQAGFHPRQLVTNPPPANPPQPQSAGAGITFSLDVEGVQVDLIPVADAHEHFDAARSYYAWNDLGNFQGRIAYSLGFRYGHRGLLLSVPDAKGQVNGEITVSLHTPTILAFLGYDPRRFEAGFDTREEIFAYAASTPFFKPAIFALENLNHTNRTRNRKRDSYGGFLAWIEERFGRIPVATEKPGLKPPAMECAYDFFGRESIEQKIAAVEAARESKREVSRRFNARLFTGVTGPALGRAIEGFKTRFASTAELEAWVLATPPSAVAAAVQVFLHEKGAEAYLPPSAPEPESGLVP